MTFNDVIQDEWMVFQCITCFNRFKADRLKILKPNTLVCPIDESDVRQLLEKEGRDARAEIG